MAEPIKTDGEQSSTPVIAAPVSAPSTPTATEEEAWWKEASEKHGFKSKEDVYKSWAESNKKISEQGEEIKNYKIFQENVVPVLDVVLGDEEILNKVKGKMDPNAPKPEAPQIKKEVSPEDADTKKYLIDDAVHSFETMHGIDKLDAETQKDVKARIGIELQKFTTGKETKVSLIKTQLEDAFALAVAKDEKLKNIFAPKDDVLGDYGSLPSQSSGMDKDGIVRLTPEQEKVAANMPGGREAYIKGLKKIPQGK